MHTAGWTDSTSNQNKLDFRLDPLGNGRDAIVAGAEVNRYKLERIVCPELQHGWGEGGTWTGGSTDATHSRLWNRIHKDYREDWLNTKDDMALLAPAVWLCVAAIRAQRQDDPDPSALKRALHCLVSLLLSCRVRGDKKGEIIDVPDTTSFDDGTLMNELDVRARRPSPSPARPHLNRLAQLCRSSRRTWTPARSMTQRSVGAAPRRSGSGSTRSWGRSARSC